jgi:hypothetical protein
MINRGSKRNSDQVLEVEAYLDPEGHVELNSGKSALEINVILLEVGDDHPELGVKFRNFV